MYVRKRKLYTDKTNFNRVYQAPPKWALSIQIPHAKPWKLPPWHARMDLLNEMEKTMEIVFS